MIRIREEQFAALQAVAQEGFVHRVAEHLQTYEPRLTESRSRFDLTTEIRVQLRNAAQFGMTDELSLVAWVLQAFRVSPRFHEHPAIARVLAEHPDAIHWLPLAVDKSILEEAKRL